MKIFLITSLLCLSGCKVFVYKYVPNYCDVDRDVYLIEKGDDYTIFKPFVKSEFEDAHRRLEPKKLMTLKSKYSEYNGYSSSLKIAFGDSINFQDSAYLVSLNLFKAISLTEDTTILRSFFNEHRMHYSSPKDTVIFINNQGFVESKCFNFHADSSDSQIFSGYGKIIIAQNQPLLFDYTVVGSRGSSTDGFVCSKVYRRKCLSLHHLKRMLF